jgi:hypothetical protein
MKDYLFCLRKDANRREISAEFSFSPLSALFRGQIFLIVFNRQPCKFQITNDPIAGSDHPFRR